MTTDMTKGSPLKQMLIFSIPFLIGNIFQQFYNIADTVIVGRTLGDLAYGAVGSTGSIVNCFVGVINAFCSGCSIILAQFFGAGDLEKVKKSFAQSISLLVVITIPFSFILTLLTKPMLVLMKIPSEMLEQAYGYLFWIFAGMLATMLYNLLSSVMRALGDSRAPLVFLVIACLVNIVLDYVFILGFNMDASGAGLATVISQLISGLLCIVYIIKKHPILHISLKHFKFDGALIVKLLYIGLPMAFLNMVLSVGGIITQFVTNGLGSVYVIAQTTGAKIENFINLVLFSLSTACSTFSAQNFGAKKYSRIVEGVRKINLVGFAWCIFAAAIMIPFGKVFINLLAGDVEKAVVDNAYKYIIINSSLCVIVSPLIILKAFLQSIGKTLWTTVSGFTEILGRGGVAVLVITLINIGAVNIDTGYTIVCFNNPCAWVLGLSTVMVDYILTMRSLKKMVKAEECKITA